MAGVIRGALCEGDDPALVPDTVIAEWGDPDWHLRAGLGLRGSAGDGAIPALVPDRPLVAPSGAVRRRGLDRRTPSSLEGGQTFDLRWMVRADNPEALARGSLVHEWFARLAWLDEGLPDAEALRPLGGKHGVPPVEVERYLDEFRGMLARPAIREQLLRESFAGPRGAGLPRGLRGAAARGPLRVDLWRERPFAIRDGDALLEGIMDRAVILRDGAGQPVGAVVLDFKTDDVPDAAAAKARAEFYRPQLAAYARAVARLTGLDAARIAARLLFVGPGVVVAVTE